MATAKPTPEEKLFAVIQGANVPPVRRKAQALSLAVVGARVASLIGPLDLPRINALLLWVVVAAGVLCLANPFLMSPRVEQVLAQAQQQAVTFRIAPPLEGLRSSDAYLDLVKQQDPFRLAAPPVEPTATTPQTLEPPVPTGPDPKAVLADLKLVGISMGDEPVAMIEQVSAKQTFFLKAGEPIGQATVKEVLSDRVILRVGEQDCELF